MTIQDYNTYFAYNPGKANSAADALSRNVALVSLVMDAPILPELSIFKLHQRSDPLCAVLICFLDLGDDGNQSKLLVLVNYFVFKDDVLSN